jgi:hypothetical protein
MRRSSANQRRNAQLATRIYGKLGITPLSSVSFPFQDNGSLGIQV